MTRRERQPHTLLATVRTATIVVAFLAVVAQMATSDLGVMEMPMDTIAASMSMTTLPCAEMCGPALVHVCLPASRVCAATVATFTPVSSLIPMLLALVALATARVVPHSAIHRTVLWLWPPERRRALLQVFLI